MMEFLYIVCQRCGYEFEYISNLKERILCPLCYGYIYITFEEIISSLMEKKKTYDELVKIRNLKRKIKMVGNDHTSTYFRRLD